jgi:hypothetical protein
VQSGNVGCCRVLEDAPHSLHRKARIETLVPTLCVGMQSQTLRVVRGWRLSKRQSPGKAKRTQSVPDGIPTQSVGTSKKSIDPGCVVQGRSAAMVCRIKLNA